MRSFSFDWEYDFSLYRPRTFEDITWEDIVDCIESETTAIWNDYQSPSLDFRFNCLNYIRGKFIFVRFRYKDEIIFIEHGRIATKGEIEKYFNF